MLPFPDHQYDIVMLGTFAAWRLGTLQARALPLAAELTRRGIRCALITTPWDMPTERGVIERIDGVMLRNTHSTSPLASLLAVRQQMQIVASLRPRAVHIMKPRGFGGFAGMAMRRELPTLVDSDDWEGDGGWNRIGRYSLPQRRIFDWQERFLLRSSSGVTAASSLLYARAASMRADSQVWLLPNGLTRPWFSRLSGGAVDSSSAATQPSVILYSRFAEFGGDWLPRFIAALEESIVASASVEVVGEPSTDSPLPATSRLTIRRHGYVARDRLPELLGRADVAVYPYDASLVTRSKQSVKLLELMAARCAVVASDVGDIPGVLAHSGVVMDGSNPVAFARAVARLFVHRRFAGSLGAAAAQRVESEYLIETTIADRLVAVYRDAGVLPT